MRATECDFDAGDGGASLERNPKRARKKEARDLRVAAQSAAYRRRRSARIAGLFVAIAAIVALMLYTTTTNDGGGESPAATSSPSPTAPSPACPKPDEAKRPEPKQFESAPEPDVVLKDGVDYFATVKTSCGNIEMDLLESDAPRNVASFVFLAREGYFDGLIWHRIERNFVIQTGDPNGRNGVPPDGPGYELPDELSGTQSRDYTFGAVAMANRGPDTAGSQWFIVVHDPKNRTEPAGLDPLYTIFAQVRRSAFSVIEKIASQPVKGGTDQIEAAQPIIPVVIESIEIIERR